MIVTGCLVTIIFFQNGALRIAIINKDIGNFVYDSMQQRTKKDKSHEKYLTCHNDTYTLRSNDRKLYLPKPKTNFLKKSFLYRGATAWNNLPNEIVDDFENHSLPAFKRLLKAQ